MSRVTVRVEVDDPAALAEATTVRDRIRGLTTHTREIVFFRGVVLRHQEAPQLAEEVICDVLEDLRVAHVRLAEGDYPIVVVPGRQLS